MSSLPAAEADSIARPLLVVSGRERTFTSLHRASLATLLAGLGLSSIWPTVVILWDLWTSDALKSIGMIVPLVGAVLIFRAWRSLDFEMQGTWWGALVLGVACLTVQIRQHAIVLLVLTPNWSVDIPPHSLIVFAYTAGVVLLFGGTRLFRAALFPILLMWLVNPTPHAFNLFIDLPLQRVSAHVARGFAMALGQTLSPDQMRLMFTPDFGMFIAPGCDGIRGALTMGFIALIAGYFYRFRWYAQAAVIVGAVMLGYVFNLVRLCTLVLYYIVALHFASLQQWAEMGDYILGAVLFLIATMLLFTVIARLRKTPAHSDTAEVAVCLESFLPARNLYPRFAVMFCFVVFGCYSAAHALIRHREEAASSEAIAQKPVTEFPKRIGDYTLVRSWNENFFTGTLAYHWGDYAPVGGGLHVALGVSPILGAHDTQICHSARGEDPLWHDQIDLAVSGGLNVSFNSALYNYGGSQFLEVSTLCTGTACGEYGTSGTHFGWIYSRPDPQSVFSRDPMRPIPILLRAETAETELPADVARKRLTNAVRSFVSSLNLNELTQSYRRD